MARPTLVGDAAQPGGSWPPGTRVTLTVIGFKEGVAFSQDQNLVILGSRETVVAMDGSYSFASVMHNDPEGAPEDFVDDPPNSAYKVTWTYDGPSENPGRQEFWRYILVPDTPGEVEISSLDPTSPGNVDIAEIFLARLEALGFEGLPGPEGPAGPEGPQGDPGDLLATRVLDPVDTVLASDGPAGSLVATNPTRTLVVLERDSTQDVDVGHRSTVIAKEGWVLFVPGIGATVTGAGKIEPGATATVLKTAANTWLVSDTTAPEVVASDGPSGPTDLATSIAGRVMDNEFGGTQNVTWLAASGARFLVLTNESGDARLRRASGGTAGSFIHRFALPHTDVEFTVRAPVANQDYGLVVRAPSGSADSGYVCRASTAAISLQRYSAGTPTSLSGTTAITHGDTVGIRVLTTYDSSGVENGAHLALLKNGAVIAVATDSTFDSTVGQEIGIRNDSGTSWRIADLIVKDWSTP